MTQYRIVDRATDTWAVYDEKTDTWREMANNTSTAIQKAPARPIESLRDNPIIEVMTGQMEATERPQMASSGQGKQTDTAETIARGVVVESAIPMGLAGLLAGLIMFLVWYTGIVEIGLFGYFVGVLGLWSALALVIHDRISKRAHKLSHYGVESQKVGATENVAHHQIDSQERIIMRAMEQHHEREMKRLGVNDDQ